VKNLPFCGGHFEIDKKLARVSEIEDMEALEGFWEDSKTAGKNTTRKISSSGYHFYLFNS
jgi:hypothetical protein